MVNLTDIFYDLVERGFIYDEDENGYNMSYGEYVAIADYGYNLIIEELEQYTDPIEWLYALKDILDTADDDASMFLLTDENWMYIDDENPEKSEIPSEFESDFRQLLKECA